MQDPTNSKFALVSRELVVSGLLPWAGPRYQQALAKLIRDHPYDPRAAMVPELLLEVYRDHPPANARMTEAEARRLGLIEDGPPQDSLLAKLRRAFGNPA